MLKCVRHIFLRSWLNTAFLYMTNTDIKAKCILDICSTPLSKIFLQTQISQPSLHRLTGQFVHIYDIPES